MIGKRIDKYDILSLIGTGSMGQVYLARDTTLHRQVAVKFLPAALRSSPESLSRLYREAQTAAALNHPNIITVYELGQHEDVPYLVMEYVEGTTLEQRIESGGLALDEMLPWSIALASGLAKAHEAGIIHRDLKPTNVIIDTDGRLRILDFGVAKLIEGEDLTARGTTIGTLAYMAPEQLDGLHIDHRVDIWALGVLMYQMATGQRPFRGIRTAALAYSILNATPPTVSALRRDLPAGFDRIISQCLAKDPRHRYHNSAVLEHDLREVATRSHVAIDSGSYRSQSRPLRTRKTRTPLIVSALLALALVVLMVGFKNDWLSSVSSSRTKPLTLAILPIRNLGTAEYEYFADGLTDDLIARASQIDGMRVLSRLSMMTFKDKAYDPSELITTLHADAALEGSVLRIGDQFHATVSLIDLQTNEIRWAETFDAELADVFTTQQEIVRNVAVSLDIDLAPEESRSIAETPTHSLTAYALCQRARQYYYRYTADANENAIALYQQALLLDSQYVDAISGLADAYTQRTLRFGQTGAWIDSALTAARYALGVDSTHADAHKALGLAYLARGWYRKALDANLRALDYNPNHFSAAGNAGMLSLLIGDLPQALQMHLRAAAVGPTQGLVAAYVANDYAQLTNDPCAEAWFDRALSIQPDLPATLGLRAYWYLSRGY
ncbi:MAG: protein kinase, partial [candidate division Zixibacteria bacterium]|nr:protein kinase [candidate division Zixibacteria bacterium]